MKFKKSVRVFTILLIILAFVFVLTSNNVIFAADGTKNVGTGFNYNQIPSNGNPMNGNLKNTFKNIWDSLVTIFQIAAVAGVIFAGVRYMFASADAKADIKKSMIHLVIGMAIVFAASTLIKVVIKVFNEVTTVT